MKPTLRNIFSIVSVLAILAATSPAARAQADIKTAEASIDPANIRTHVQFLSDDLMEGRYPGLRGGELAAKYIATQFAIVASSPPATTAPTFRTSTSSA